MAVYNRSKEALLQASELVRTETLESANSAERVGQLFYDITEHILDVTVTPEYPAGTNSVLVADIVVDGLNNLIYAPKGGGGGPTNDGYQKVYFATVLKGVTVQAPTSEDYDPSADGGTGAFTRSTPQWHSTDDLPAEGECVYAIWVYFNANNLIVTIDGPVVINSGNSGSNGEDGEEIEWIYIRRAEELTSAQVTLILNFLETCKGSAAAKDGKTFNDPDAVPQGDWTDNAQGISEQIQYEYAAFRRSKNNSNGERTWGDDYFHGPLLWSAYGKQGMDGDGIEYIFYADRDGSPSWGSGDYPPNWNSNTQGNWKDPNDHSKGRWTFLDDEFIAEGSRWTDNPINIETLQKGAKQWSCMRKKQDGVWQAYQAPTLWSYYAKDGVANGYTTDIVNENMPVGTDNEGTATNYRNYGRVQAFHNDDVLQYTSAVGAGGYPAEGYFTYIIGDNITRSDDPEHTALNIIVTHDLNDGAQFNVFISSISNFANINAYIPITVKLPNGTDQYLECTLYGIATGEAGQAVDIWTNADVIRDNDTGLGTAPAQLQIGVKIGRGEDVHTYYSGGVPSAESMNFYFGYRYDDGQMLALTPGTLTLEPNHSTLTIEMRQGNSFAEGHFVDSEDIPYVKNGATITNIQPYYRAVASESLKPGTNGYPDISQSDSQTVEGTTFGSSYPFLYRRDYYTFSDGVSYFGVTVFDRRYFEPAEATYTISTINDNAAIDDLTVSSSALRTATLNPIAVYKGNDNVTSECIFDIVNRNLKTTEIDVESTTESDYPSSKYKVYHIVLKNDTLTKLTPGSYSYDVLISDSSYNEIGRKRFKLYIDKDISTDGSFYKLVIENDTIEYDSSGTVVSLDAPTAKVYKVPINGDPVQLSATVVKTKPTTPSENLYLLVDNTLYNAATTSQQDIVFNTANIPYKADKYELTLYKGNKYQDGPEYIDCTKEASAGVDGYSLVTNPAYIIIDELISSQGTTDSSGVTTYYALTLTANELKQQYAIIKVLKGKVPQVIGVGLNTFNTTIGAATIVDASTGGTVSSSTTALKVYLTSVPQKTASSSPTGWNQSEGKITFTVTLGGSSFYSVEIPVYINRLGTRFLTIAGDVETTVMSKCTYTDEQGRVVRGDTMGNYVRSSELNRQALTSRVNGIETNTSEIKQTSDAISLGVTNGWKNYITNPVATDGHANAGTHSTVEDSTFGKVVQVSNSSGGDWQLEHNIDAAYSELTGKAVTWFCVIRNVNYGHVHFGSGSNETKGNLHAVQVQSTPGAPQVTCGLNTSYYNSINSGVTSVGDNWYLCWVSATPKDDYSIIDSKSTYVNAAGFNSMTGTWRIYYCGIVMGTGCPSIEMIKEGAGLKKAGIDITQGEIILKANKTKFTNSSGTIDNKIWIDNNTGTLHAVDGDFSGTVHASSGDFTGTIHASDGEFSGVVAASMFYTGVKKVTTNYNIDLDGDPYNAYVIWIPNSGERVCTLPSPASYIGLEIEFFVPLLSRSSGGTAAISSSVNIRYNDSDGFINSNNKLTMPFNKFIRLKALDINGGLAEWWVTTGDKWDSNGDPVIS